MAPTFEVHVNTPLNHRDPFDANDLAGTPDVVNLTYGVNFEFCRTAVLTFGFVTPVTGPKPFDFEALLLFNLRFGGSRRARRRPSPIARRLSGPRRGIRSGAGPGGGRSGAGRLGGARSASPGR